MKKRIFFLPYILYATLVLTIFLAGCTFIDPDQGLLFPYKNPNDVSYFYCFGLTAWDNDTEIHGGIDLVVPQGMIPTVIYKVPVVAPADGKVAVILEGSTGHGCVSFIVLLELNPYWYVVCNFEPQSKSKLTLAEQKRSILVRENQIVRKGEKIGDLVVWNVLPEAYAHLHYGLFYKNPKDTLEDIRDHYMEIPRSDGSDLAPITGPGSPWRPEDLYMKTTFYCPYEYSEKNARDVFDSKPKKAANGDDCSCVCAYGSQDGDCGNAALP